MTSLRLLITQAVSVVAALMFILAPSANATHPGANGQIAFVRGSDDDELWLVDDTGANLTLLADLSSTSPDYFVLILSPSWSPDGSKLAFEYRQLGANTLCTFPNGDFLCSSVAILDVATGEMEILRSDVAPGATPAWSPDGTQIVFAGNAKRGDFSGSTLYVMNSDGTQVKRLTHKWGPKPVVELNPSWSPDGNRIVFFSDRHASDTKSWSLYTVEASGGKEQKLIQNDGNDMDPDWSPDGTQILFVRTFEFPDYRLYTVNPDGTAVTELLQPNTPVAGPQWSPDGTKIVYSAESVVYVVNANGSGVTSIASGESPTWRPIP